ncbi:MAG: esterase [Firmicutes bacterium]|nr:esterase [Bacillota bacterium]
MKKKIITGLTAVLIVVMMAFSLSACGSQNNGDNSSSDAGTKTASSVEIDASDVKNPDNIEDLKIDNSKWQYDKDNDVYYQIGVSYAADADADDYESMAVYVPGAYMNAKSNGDGTYTCTVNNDGKAGDYTAETAPIVMPINTAGYSAQAAPTSYSYNNISSYIEEGYIYLDAGCRGRDNGENSDGSSYDGGAPWGATDLKAAIRCYRYNSDSLPGDSEKIFTFGMSGGGAQSAIMGASGDNSLYFDYLEAIGAAMKTDDGEYISDAVYGSMCWCPITNLDTADEAYEWMMGQYSSSGTRASSTWTSALSDDLAEAYASYINDLKLTDEDGNTLTLEESDKGIYNSGTYYEYLKETIETSLNNFLEDTEFPYTAGSSDSSKGDLSGAPSGDSSGGAPSGNPPSDSGSAPSGNPPSDSGSAPSGNPPSDSGSAPSGEPPTGAASEAAKSSSGSSNGGQAGTPAGGNSSSLSGTYKSASAYVKALNKAAGTTWLKYDKDSNKVTVLNVKGFVKACKNATKDVGAFDSLERSTAENKVFGNGDSNALHFDSIMASLISENADKYSKYSDWDESYVKEYSSDLKKEDSQGNVSETRQNMYNPMYYLCEYYDGCGTSNTAKYWRINTGIEQGDTSLTTEINLALALESSDSVEDVDFTTVWAQGHSTAERSGNSTANFIKWVNSCCK